MTAPSLTEFLLARITDDEAQARSAEGGEDWWAYHLDGRKSGEDPHWIIDSAPRLISYEVTSEGSAQHIGAWSPARVLAECEAKRRIVEMHRGFKDEHPGTTALHLLAVIYSDHPDYREAWRA